MQHVQITKRVRKWPQRPLDLRTASGRVLPF
jgi:hypothetical protein